MDKFTKTTEVDISAMNVIEEDPPKKSKAGKVIAIIISLLLSVAIWLYVIETDDRIYEDSYKNVQVQIINPGNFNVSVAPVDVILKGTTSDLVDIKAEDIVVELDARQITKIGIQAVKLTVKVNHDNVTAELENSDIVNVDVTLK